MHVYDARCNPFSARVNDRRIVCAKSRANRNNLAFAQQYVRVVEPLAGARQNRGTGQQRCRPGQRMISTRKWRRFIVVRVIRARSQAQS